MKISIHYATLEDLHWLKNNDKHVDIEVLNKKILDNEVIIVKKENSSIGWLRFGFFWDEIPFMNMLFINEEYRKKGIGKKLVQFWEKEMKKRRYKIIMTSSQSDEDAQHFYRKIGYTDAGSLTLPEQPLEVFFIKKI